MIASKTYTGLEGTNYVQAPELAMTIVYVVKREGLLYEKYISGSSNRTHVYAPSEARVYFPTNFNTGGEKVFVLYKETSAVIVPVPVCVQVSFSGFLPNGIVGVPYSYSFYLGGTAPFAISDITAPAWAAVALDPSGTLVNVTGTPDAATTELIEFTVTNCSAGSQTFNQSFDIAEVETKLYISNISSGGVLINSASGFSYVILTGSFPLAYGTGITGVHGAFTSVITLNITGIIFPQTLSISKNGSLLQSISVTTDGNHNFSIQTFLSTDLLEIVLE